jgi:hypothetical protein
VRERRVGVTERAVVREWRVGEKEGMGGRECRGERSAGVMERRVGARE